MTTRTGSVPRPRSGWTRHCSSGWVRGTVRPGRHPSSMCAPGSCWTLSLVEAVGTLTSRAASPFLRGNLPIAAKVHARRCGQADRPRPRHRSRRFLCHSLPPGRTDGHKNDGSATCTRLRRLRASASLRYDLTSNERAAPLRVIKRYRVSLSAMIPTIGIVPFAPSDPWKRASPKVNTPPSAATRR